MSKKAGNPTKATMNLIKPLVEHLLTQQDSDHWRKALLKAQVLSAEELAALDDAAIKASFKVLKTLQLAQLSGEELVDEIERQDMLWSIDLPMDYQQGAICY